MANDGKKGNCVHGTDYSNNDLAITASAKDNFWTVDLDSPTFIHRVNTYFRTSGWSEQNTNYEVRLGDH
jgi:hypothetical protein